MGRIKKFGCDHYISGWIIFKLHFDFENNGFHLSLDQGSNFPKKQTRKDISNYLIKLINENNLNTPQGFLQDANKLYDDTIMSKFYNINNITINEFENDLELMIDFS